MKKTISILALGLLAGLAAVSCQKAASEVDINAQLSKEIVFRANNTKANAVTGLTSFNVLATKGAEEAESAFNDSFANSQEAPTIYKSTVTGGRLWPITDPTYHFYASNLDITYAANASTVAVDDNSVDVVCAKETNPEYAQPNALTFDHIFARIGTITINTQTGYRLSDVSASVTFATAGTWNLVTEKWSIEDGAEAVTDVAAFSGDTEQQVSDNDLYVVPATSYTTAGTNLLSVTYTLTKDAYTETFTKTANLNLQIGKVNNITATAIGGDATEIQFTITVTEWGNNEIEIDENTWN